MVHFNLKLILAEEGLNPRPRAYEFLVRATSDFRPSGQDLTAESPRTASWGFLFGSLDCGILAIRGFELLIYDRAGYRVAGEVGAPCSAR